MAISEEEIERIIEAVRETGLVYAMGETSYYNPATVFARNQHAAGKFGRIFYSEGDYVHDMDLGFYEAYQYSGGEAGRRRPATRPCSTPPTPSAASWVLPPSPRGQRQLHRRQGRPRRRRLRQGRQHVRQRLLQRHRAVRTERRRCHAHQRDAPGGLPVPHPRIPVPLLRHRGQLRAARQGHGVAGQGRRARHLRPGGNPGPPCPLDDPSLADVAPELRDAFISGLAPVHDQPDACRRSSLVLPTATKAATNSWWTTS